jgi:glucose/arabinose dehydrogenase
MGRSGADPAGGLMKVSVKLRLWVMAAALAPLLLQAAAPVDPLANPPTPAFPGQTRAPAPDSASQIKQQVVATGLNLPRSLVALPDGNMIVTEGAGTVRILSPDGKLSQPLPGMPDILSVAGRSMNDFIIDAKFSENRVVYFTYAAPVKGQKGGPRTAQERDAAAAKGETFQVDQLARAVLSKDLGRIENVQVIGVIPGRRLLSKADGTLFISTMAFNNQSALAQNPESLAGKFLRIQSDGSIPADNPFVGRGMVKPEIFSMGHRDPDGVAVHPLTGEVWAIEHGPMGGDELNIIRKGKNYGWPIITYGKEYDGSEIGYSQRYGFEQPLYYWFPSVAPSGLLFYTGSLFPDWKNDLLIGTLSPTQGKFLVHLKINGEKVVSEEHLLVANDRRVRSLAQDRDGAVYVLTDSEDNNQTNRHFPGQVLKLTPP